MNITSLIWWQVLAVRIVDLFRRVKDSAGTLIARRQPIRPSGSVYDHSPLPM